VLQVKEKLENRKPCNTASHYKHRGISASFKGFSDLNPNNAQQNPKSLKKKRV
jgi:hypothetical protein